MDGKGLAPLATNHFVAGAVLSTSEDGLKLETSEIHNEKIDAERRRARLEQGRADDGGLYEILAQAKVRKEQEFIEMHKPLPQRELNPEEEAFLRELEEEKIRNNLRKKLQEEEDYETFRSAISNSSLRRAGAEQEIAELMKFRKRIDVLSKNKEKPDRIPLKLKRKHEVLEEKNSLPEIPPPSPAKKQDSLGSRASGIALLATYSEDEEE